MELTKNTNIRGSPDRIKAVFREMYDTVTKAVNENDYEKTTSEESGG